MPRDLLELVARHLELDEAPLLALADPARLEPRDALGLRDGPDLVALVVGRGRVEARERKRRRARGDGVRQERERRDEVNLVGAGEGEARRVSLVRREEIGRDARRDGEEALLTVRAPLDAVDGHTGATDLPLHGAPANCRLPQAHLAVLGARDDPHARRVEADAPHAHAVRVLVRHRTRRREGAQLLRRGQAREELARVLDVELGAAAQRARREVQVEAPVEALLDKVGVRGDVPQRRKLARHDLALLVLGLELVELALLLLGPQVLGGRVERLGVSRERHLGRGHVHRMRRQGHVVGVPQRVEPRLLRRARRTWPPWRDAASADRPHNLHDLLVLPLGGEEARLGLGSCREGHVHDLRREVGDGGRVAAGVARDVSEPV